MSIIKGGDLMLFCGGKSIAFATNHTLSLSLETKETTSKDSGGKWQTAEGNILSWTCQSENLLANQCAGIGYDDLFDYMIAREPITGVFAIKSQTADTVPTDGWTAKAGDGYTGQMLITSLEKNAPNGDNASFTVQFTGVGALTKVKAGS